MKKNNVLVLKQGNVLVLKKDNVLGPGDRGTRVPGRYKGPGDRGTRVPGLKTKTHNIKTLEMLEFQSI